MMKHKLLILLLLSLLSFSQFSSATNTQEKLLLAYVYNLAKFIEWPEDSIATEAPIDICFYGSLGELTGKTKLLDKQTISQHPIQTKEIERGGELSNCHIVFISASEEIYYRPLLAKLNDSPTLTISNLESFIRADGMIALVYSNDKLRFDINKKRIDASGLKVSSQILRLARKVIE